MAEDLEIVYRPPGPLKPYDRNSRTHSKDQVQQIRRSIDRFGFTNPILLRDDEISIGAGHGRQLAALLDPPIDRVPTITIRGLSDEEWRALIIADNRIAEKSGWDEGLLRLELADLGAAGFDLTLTGFTDLELGDIFDKSNRKSGSNDAPPAPVNPVSVDGDIWVLGSHRIMCGDARQAQIVAALFAGKKAELCLTDPPYGIGFDYAEHDDSNNDLNAELVAAVFEHAPAAKVWTPGKMNLARDIARFGETKVLAWHKGFAAAGNGLGGASTWEPVLVLAPKHKRLPNDYLDFKTDREELEGKALLEHHPCPKPVDLFTHLAKAFCSPKGIIYEPFSGSGTTLIASEAAGRTCYACEIGPAYVDVAVMRFAQAHKVVPILEDTGETFEQVRDRRLGEVI